MNIQNSKKFASDRHEELPDISWSDFEIIVLKEVASAQSDDIDAVLQLYLDVLAYGRSPFCVHPLPANTTFRSKTLKQVAAKLRHGLTLTS